MIGLFPSSFLLLPLPVADFVLANPPFNVSDWRGKLVREDTRWKYRVPRARETLEFMQ